MNRIAAIYFSASGRLRRLQYFFFGLLPKLILIGIFQLAQDEEYMQHLPLFMQGLLLLVVLINIYAIFVLMIKRFHDFNYSGWWGLLCFIPFINLAVGLMLLFNPGTQGPNRFGDLT